MEPDIGLVLTHPGEETISACWTEVLQSVREDLHHGEDHDESHGDSHTRGDALDLAGAELAQEEPGDGPDPGPEDWKQESLDIDITAIDLRERGEADK